ncbi:MAG: hypothetical protein R3C11_08410 [Planctomycetaceae bacterium]
MSQDSFLSVDNAAKEYHEYRDYSKTSFWNEGPGCRSERIDQELMT